MFLIKRWPGIQSTDPAVAWDLEFHHLNVGHVRRRGSNRCWTGRLITALIVRLQHLLPCDYMYGAVRIRHWP
ncbi:hypothetical protein Pmani_013487 [Petrolisthes manimaculis]|uniref:Uncharacterized protein n=1 Tax=Petrolisthes manimaculis TaxID=1843537 RepID=A0AAE1PV66_9EUCA|nr:hypothetical protein Pmani_013487 [Petrolisthes manimaculis]